VTAPELTTASHAADEAAALFDEAGDARGLTWLWNSLGSLALQEREVDQARQFIERSLALNEQIDDPIDATYALAASALVALESGDDAAAAARLGETLARRRAYGLRQRVPEALLALGSIAVRAGDPGLGARLLGASAALRAGRRLSRLERRLYSNASHEARARYPEQAWTRAHAAGRQLSREDAITLGIEAANRYANNRAATPGRETA
jgi:tetratricopeptide (TPR) repeat protein